ncbi:MAG TPA: NO-inducible flavohemoprotein [Rhodopila sp.]|uniref:NO-inducible flavohemoprotein n=1 Tax=Rhodopila sp. TaxID=2480087 RepID=UPI002C4A3B12|nr:NO-inducible flavohemoprotein [Rhodopila sp.]HVY13998.1 NO-inducible flavohemoprotein [Rhodopila sp.]
MLTSEQTAIIKATVPILETGGEALTTHFYKIMLGEHAEVRPLFNQAHQASGAQPRALANSVLMYARHIDNLGALGALPAQIINKHVALQVQPEHYPIVGSCLLRAIREVLGAEVATDAVIDAWAAAYGQLADILIGAEAKVYDQLAAAPGGWRGARPFRVARKVAESAEITSFYLEPADDQAVVAYQPGQYLGLRLVIDGQEVRRNYSLSQVANGRDYRISVKREPHGLVSNYLHDSVNEGATLDVFPPAGEFTLSSGTGPVVLISGGVGITPTIAMAEAALAGGGRDVVFIHYARNSGVHAFGATIDGWVRRYPRLRAYVAYEQGALRNGAWPTALGRPAMDQLKAWVPTQPEADAYVLGPKPFMGFVRRSLVALGLADDRVHHEFFGPTEALA